MVKVLVLLLNSVIVGKAFSDVTNLSQIVGVPLSQSVVAQIHTRDFSSPETAYLSFLKSVFTCDASGFVAGFRPEIIVRMTGGGEPRLVVTEADQYNACGPWRYDADEQCVAVIFYFESFRFCDRFFSSLHPVQWWSGNQFISDWLYPHKWGVANFKIP